METNKFAGIFSNIGILVPMCQNSKTIIIVKIELNLLIINKIVLIFEFYLKLTSISFRNCYNDIRKNIKKTATQNWQLLNYFSKSININYDYIETVIKKI